MKPTCSAKTLLRAGLLPAGAIHVVGGRAWFPFHRKTLADRRRRPAAGNARGQHALAAWAAISTWTQKTAWRFPLPVQLTLGGIYLSGDDPATARCEGWDPAFSRWPKWSDSLIYLQAKETRVADWTNFISIYGNLLFEPLEKVKLNLAWHHLLAAEKTLPSAMLSGTGRGRGELFIVKITYDIGKNLAGRLIWENFRPGDFYFSGANAYSWVQFELFFRY